MFDCSECDKKYTQSKSLTRHYRTEHLGVRYSCEFCDKYFNCDSRLKAHTHNVHGGANRKTIDCPKCDEKFEYRKNLKQHYRWAHSGKRFKCKLCGADIDGRVKLKNHMKSAHPVVKSNQRENEIEKLFGCPKCDKSYTKMDSLKRHSQSAHLGVRFYCKLCEGSFADKYYLNNHTQVCHNDGVQKLFECSTCEKTFTDRKNLSRHYRMVHSGIRYYCELCGNDFARKHNIRSHILSFHGYGNRKMFECSKCDKKYLQSEGLDRHYRLVHSGVRSYCDLCGKDFTQKCSLRNHMISTHGFGIPKMFNCSMCENSYPNNGTLNRHYRSAHLGIRFYCGLCGNDFIKKNGLRVHIQSVHLGIKFGYGVKIPKTFDCSICQEKYAERGNLNRHYQSAHSITRFSCEICEKDFTHKRNLKSHTIAFHSDGVRRKFDCLKCEKTYSDKSNLNRHYRLAHSGVEFCCELCGSDFAQKHQLTSHMKSYHGYDAPKISLESNLTNYGNFPPNFTYPPEGKLYDVPTNRNDYSLIYQRNSNANLEIENAKLSYELANSNREEYSDENYKNEPQMVPFANANKSDNCDSNLPHNAAGNNNYVTEWYSSSTDANFDGSIQRDKNAPANSQTRTLNQALTPSLDPGSMLEIIIRDV